MYIQLPTIHECYARKEDISLIEKWIRQGDETKYLIMIQIKDKTKTIEYRYHEDRDRIFKELLQILGINKSDSK